MIIRDQEQVWENIMLVHIVQKQKKILNYDYVTVIYYMAIGYQFPLQFGQNNKSSQNNK